MQEKGNFMERLATFIVDKRNIIFLIFAAACMFCCVSTGWVETNEDLTEYLPEGTETRRGLTQMEEEITTFATGRIMVDNITLEKALDLQRMLEETEGVK